MSLAHHHRVPFPRAWTYAFASAAYAMGAPLGYLLLRSVLASEPPSPSWISQELQSQPILYAYLTFSTATALVLLGVGLGRKEDRLDALSMTDALTGLANRRCLDRRLAEEFSRALRYDESLSLLLVDIDDLKAINDARGHRAGDAAIAAVAQSLQKTCRSTDFAARAGGDEFVVLAPSISAEGAVELAYRVQETLAASGREVSVSIGVADLQRSARSSSEALCAAADRALYAAKAEGRNCVRLAPGSAPP